MTKTTCIRCFCYVLKPLRRGDSEWLLEHQRLSSGNYEITIKLPSHSRAHIQFDKVIQQYRIPVVYADLKSTLVPLELQEEVNSRTKYQLHTPNSYCLLIQSTLSEDQLCILKLSSTPKIYLGGYATRYFYFIDDLYSIAEKVVEKMYRDVLPMRPMTEDEINQYDSATCYQCTDTFKSGDLKVRHHDNLTGAFRSAACNACN